MGLRRSGRDAERVDGLVHQAVAGAIETIFAGSCSGGKAGHWLGVPIDLLMIDQTRAQYGPISIESYDLAFGRRGAIANETQMTLFTAEGLLRAACGRHGTGLLDST